MTEIKFIKADENNIPSYIKANLATIIEAIRYARPEQIILVRELLTEAAKRTIDMELNMRARGEIK